MPLKVLATYMPEPSSTFSPLGPAFEGETVVLREGLARLFPADPRATFDDLLQAIDLADKRQREPLP
jgi:hypothetical protein